MNHGNLPTKVNTATTVMNIPATMKGKLLSKKKELLSEDEEFDESCSPWNKTLSACSRPFWSVFSSYVNVSLQTGLRCRFMNDLMCTNTCFPLRLEVINPKPLSSFQFVSFPVYRINCVGQRPAHLSRAFFGFLVEPVCIKGVFRLKRLKGHNTYLSGNISKVSPYFDSFFAFIGRC